MTNDTPFCNKCITAMERSTAFVNDNVVMGLADFPGAKIGHGQTMSVDNSTAVEIPCWKCPACGHSIRIIRGGG